MRNCLVGFILMAVFMHGNAQVRHNPNKVIDQVIQRSEQALFDADFDKAIRLVRPQALDSLQGIEPKHKILLMVQSIRVHSLTNIVRMKSIPKDQNYKLLAPYLNVVHRSRDKTLKGKYYLAYSNALRSLGNADSASVYENRSMAYFQKARKKDQVAQIRASKISRIHNQLLANGNLNEILRLIPLYQKEIDYAQKHKNKYALAYNTRHLGQIYRRQTTNYQEALRWFRRSLELREEIGFKPFIPASVSSLGDVYAKMGEDELAIEAYLKSVELAQEIGFVRYESYPLQAIGDIYLKQGDKEKAREYFEEARDSAAENGFIQGLNVARERLKELERL